MNLLASAPDPAASAPDPLSGRLVDRFPLPEHHRRVGSQAAVFDRARIPWVWDPDLGEIAAAAHTRAGDGEFMYDSDGDEPYGPLVVVANPFAHRAVACRHKRWARAMEKVEEMGRRVVAERDAAPESEEESSSSSSDDEFDEEGYPRPARLRRRRGGLTQQSQLDAQLAQAGCVVTKHHRPNGGREDLKIVTPDGRAHRSKVEALRHLEATGASRGHGSEDSD